MSLHVTMKTIAAQAGVTQATVSMCLANNPRIPAATRARIRAVADRLGYRPNPYVSALMRHRRRGTGPQEKPVIALVNALDSPAAWRDTAPPTVRLMRTGALERAALRGYRAQEFWLHQEGMSPARFSDILHTRGIQGLLLGPLSFGAAPPALKWELFTPVRLGVPLPALTLTTVCNDHFSAALQTAVECHRRGYRRPGLVILRHHRERFLGRWDGGLGVGRHLLPDLAPAESLLLDTWDDLAPVAGWLKRAKPDVVISPSAEIIQSHLRRLDWRIPRDLGLASLACPALNHPCSGIWQNGALIGATAMDTLISMLERNERGLPEQAHTVMVEGIWNRGRTLRPG
jgi:DNA-binding LacI/PurR family transcriptional regulator